MAQAVEISQGSPSASCACCDGGETLISPGLSIAVRVGQGWANGSVLSLENLALVTDKGYDPAAFAGHWQIIEVVEAYPIFSHADADPHGTWYRRITRTHSGAAVVATEGEISYSDVDTSDPDPVLPLYADTSAWIVADSDISVSGGIDPEEVRAEAAANAGTGPWTATGDGGLVPELGGYLTGAYLSEGGGFAIAQQAIYAGSWEMEDYSPETSQVITGLADGDLPLPITAVVTTLVVDTEETSDAEVSWTVPWRAADLRFSDADLTDPASANWRTLAFDATGAAYRVVVAAPGRADLWPILVLE